jgi:hypothetical protein
MAMLGGNLPGIGEGDEYELRGDALRLYDAAVDGKLIDWRVECFMGVGFSATQAVALAVRRDIDRVVVEKAIKAGQSHKHVMEALL